MSRSVVLAEVFMRLSSASVCSVRIVELYGTGLLCCTNLRTPFRRFTHVTAEMLVHYVLGAEANVHTWQQILDFPDASTRATAARPTAIADACVRTSVGNNRTLSRAQQALSRETLSAERSCTQSRSMSSKA